jgi:MoaA/NifB/PqqE/SkfB family radical SAM enzyme/GT2 family glycosyltransferase
MKTVRFYSSRMTCAKRLFTPGRQLPVYLLMFVTNRCHAACDHCFYWRELNEKVRDELTLDEYERVARSLGPLFQVTLTGGSPELRTDLPEIAEIFSRHCTPSNLTFCMLGHATDRILGQAEKILKQCPEQKFTFAISLDGLGEEHDRLRHLPGCFERATATLRALGQLKPHHRNLRLAVGLTVHALNYRSAEDTARWVRTNLPVDVLKPILIRGDPLNRETLDRVCVSTYLDVTDQDRAWLNGKQGRRFSPMDYVVNCKESLSREIIRQTSVTGRSPIKCAGGRETAVIYPTGEVAGCELRADVLGNVRAADYDFKRIWLGEAAEKFRATTGRTIQCRGCYHHCFISPAIFRTPRFWPELLRTAWSISRSHSRPEPPRPMPATRLEEDGKKGESGIRPAVPVLVIIPAHQADRTLSACVAALHASRSVQRLETLVVHDDNGVGQEELKVRQVRSPVRDSAAAARNCGAAELRQGILVFLDADVLVDAETIRRLIEPIVSGEADATVGNYSLDVEGLNFLQSYKQLHIATVYGRRSGYLKNEFWTAIGAVRAEAFHQVGGFNPSFRGACGEDTELGQRLTAAGFSVLSVPGATGRHLHEFTLSKLLRNDFRKGTQTILNALRHRNPLSDYRHSARPERVAVLCAAMLPAMLLLAGLLPAAVLLGLLALFFIVWGGAARPVPCLRPQKPVVPGPGGSGCAAVGLGARRVRRQRAAALRPRDTDLRRPTEGKPAIARAAITKPD